MKVEGKLTVIEKTQVISDKFQKREFVLTTDEDTDYPQTVKFQLTQGKCDLIDKFTIGQMVEVSFNLRGREWTNPEGKKVYFNTLEAWRITPADTAPVQDFGNSEGDDLPF